MKTRSVKSSHVSALSTTCVGCEGEIACGSTGRRHGPMPPMSSHAEAAPGPPLIAKVTGRLCGSAPSSWNVVVAMSAIGLPLSASDRRMAPAVAFTCSVRPGRSRLVLGGDRRRQRMRRHRRGQVPRGRVSRGMGGRGRSGRFGPYGCRRIRPRYRRRRAGRDALWTLGGDAPRACSPIVVNARRADAANRANTRAALCRSSVRVRVACGE